MASDRERLRDLESQAAGACLVDPFGATCRQGELQTDQVRQQVGIDADLLNRCRRF